MLCHPHWILFRYEHSDIVIEAKLWNLFLQGGRLLWNRFLQFFFSPFVVLLYLKSFSQDSQVSAFESRFFCQEKNFCITSNIVRFFGRNVFCTQCLGQALLPDRHWSVVICKKIYLDQICVVLFFQLHLQRAITCYAFYFRYPKKLPCRANSPGANSCDVFALFG